MTHAVPACALRLGEGASLTSTTPPPRRPCGERGPMAAPSGSKVLRPRLNQGARLLEETAARVGGLGLVLDHVRQRRFHHRMRRMGPLGRIVAEARAEPVRDRVEPELPKELRVRVRFRGDAFGLDFRSLISASKTYS